jgi:hypothetical protein
MHQRDKSESPVSGRSRRPATDPELSVRQDPQSGHLTMYEDHGAWHQHNAHAIVFVTNSLTDLAATVWRATQEGRRVSWLNLVLHICTACVPQS